MHEVRTPSALEPVRKTVVVPASQETAFTVFTQRISDWWIKESHYIGKDTPTEIILEPFAGGRLFERSSTGEECDWGRVIAWNPPESLTLGWHLNPEWDFDPSPEKATEVFVSFTAEGEGSTRVELEHRGFAVHLDRGKELRDSVDSEGGWTEILARYQEVAKG